MQFSPGLDLLFANKSRLTTRLMSQIAGLCLAGWIGPVAAAVDILPVAGVVPEIEAVRGELQSALARTATTTRNIRVTIGPEALRAALAKDATSPLIATFVTSTEFANAVGAEPRPHVTAIYSNPDPLDQVALARGILRNAKIGVVDAPGSRALSLPLTRQPSAQVTPIPLGNGPVVNTFLQGVRGLDAVIVLPDTEVLNQGNVNYVVRALYQQRKVLIGYSDTLTRVGALASVFPRRAAIVERVAATVSEFVASGTMPAPQFVRDVDITLNERLARSLNIVLPDLQELRAHVQRRPLERPQ